MRHSHKNEKKPKNGIPYYLYRRGEKKKNVIPPPLGDENLNSACSDPSSSSSESYYSSPPDFSLTKSPVFKTSSRPYLLKYGVSLDTPWSSIDRPLHTRKCMDAFFSIEYPSLCREQPWNVRSLKKIAGFLGGGYRRISLLLHLLLLLFLLVVRKSKPTQSSYNGDHQTKTFKSPFFSSFWGWG